MCISRGRTGRGGIRVLVTGGNGGENKNLKKKQANFLAVVIALVPFLFERQSYSLYKQVMPILILINVQYL